jgi:hypothetical protein
MVVANKTRLEALQAEARAALKAARVARKKNPKAFRAAARAHNEQARLELEADIKARGW